MDIQIHVMDIQIHVMDIQIHVMDIQIHVMDIQMQKCLSARLRWFLRNAKQSKFAKWEMETQFANQL